MREDKGQGYIYSIQGIKLDRSSRVVRFIDPLYNLKTYQNRRSRYARKAFRKERRLRNGNCIICGKYSILQNYHISYKYRKIILACRSCNKVEYLLRTGKSLKNNQLKRAKLIIEGGYTYKYIMTKDVSNLVREKSL